MKASTLVVTLGAAAAGTWAWMKGKFPGQASIESKLGLQPTADMSGSADDGTLDNMTASGPGGGGGFNLRPVPRNPPPKPKVVLPAATGSLIAKTGKANTVAALVRSLGCKHPSTMNAVRDFQQYLGGLTVDGKYGPATQAQVNRWSFPAGNAPPPCTF